MTVIKRKVLVENKPNFWKNRTQLNVTILNKRYKITERDKGGDYEAFYVSKLSDVYDYALRLRQTNANLIVGISIHTK